MKKSLILAIAILTLSASTCEKINTELYIYGTWMMRYDNSHYFDATFNPDGTYEWFWYGAQGKRKDTGTFTYEDNVITMTPQKFWEEEWSTGGLIETNAEHFEWSGPRVVTVVENLQYMASWTWTGCNVFSSSKDFGVETMPVFHKGTKVPDESILKGRWEGSELLNDHVIWVFDGNTFAKYEITDANGDKPLQVVKKSGTWTSDGYSITFSYKRKQTSYKRFDSGKIKYYTVDPKTFEAEQWSGSDINFTDKCFIFVCLNRMFLGDGNYMFSKMLL